MNKMSDVARPTVWSIASALAQRNGSAAGARVKSDGPDWFGSDYVEHNRIAIPRSVITEMRKLEIDAAAAARQLAEEEKAARNRQDEEEDAADDKRRAAGWPVPDTDQPGPYLKIFDKQDVLDFTQNLDANVRDREGRERAKALLKMLAASGEYRLLATIPATWRLDLQRFGANFPNFAEVIDYVGIACALAEQNDRVLHFCMLLSGSAGTGKSLFSQTLANWVGGGYACVRYESAENASEMSGSSSFWSNTTPGKPFTLLTETQYANPTFFLDEIDKVSAVQYNPLGALYALLEPGTAREHVDASWPFLRLDCSKINYVAACNDRDRIPGPLLSRLRKFDIPPPTADQSMAIAYNIVTEERAKHAPEMQFSDAAMQALCQLTPRRMRQMAQEALGRALLHERDVVRAEDIPPAESRKRSIGFLDSP